MPVLSILAQGVSVGVAPTNNNHDREKRGTATGWSTKATRNNTRWLQSVDSSRLDGKGYAVTLTLRRCPDTAKQWAALRQAFFARLRRAGMTRMHWVVEFQRRRVPHLHCALWFDNDATDKANGALVLRHWLAVSYSHGSGRRGQDAKPIHAFTGWSQYVSKHASRGMDHYQRSTESQPPGWESPGRVWGHFGLWPMVEPIKVDLTSAAFYQLRRILQKIRLKDAERHGDKKRIKQAKKLLKSHSLNHGRVMGMADWMDRDLALEIVRMLMRDDAAITPVLRTVPRLHHRLGLCPERGQNFADLASE